MPICDNKQQTPTPPISNVDIDHNAEIAKVKKIREQAYFNSYDFDAIKVHPLPGDEDDEDDDDTSNINNNPSLAIDNIQQHQQQQQQHSHHHQILKQNNLDTNSAISNVYLKRLTSYFTTGITGNHHHKTIENHKNDDTELEDVHNRSERSNSSSCSSADSSKTLYNGSKKELNTKHKTLNSFLLPRAMLKYQSGLATTSTSTLPTTNLSTTISMNDINRSTTIATTSNEKTLNRKKNSNYIIHGYDDKTERIIPSSHYSTEKSGSSGYYGSNLCSASSVEEHIYSEPVIDIIERISTLKKLQPPLVNNNKKNNNLDICYDHTKTDQVNKDLRKLETSIENLDRHLKSYPKIYSIQSDGVGGNGGGVGSCQNDVYLQIYEKQKSQQLLPTIMEGIDIQQQISKTKQPLPTNSWSDDMDDSLMDINLDSFLLHNELEKGVKKSTTGGTGGGIDNPTFNKHKVLDEEILENNYKCSKYVNSCPEDAYKVESCIDNVDNDKSLAFFLKKYEDQIHFQNTKDMLEEIRDKLRSLVTLANGSSSDENDVAMVGMETNSIPKELEKNIATLKIELETYLQIMNYNSERELKQFCSGLVKNQKLLTLTKAFERRKSLVSTDYDYDLEYERIHINNDDSSAINTIRFCSDPNFQLKRKTLSDIFPPSDDGEEFSETILQQQQTTATIIDNVDDDDDDDDNIDDVIKINNILNVTQLQRNLSFEHKQIDKHQQQQQQHQQQDNVIETDKDSILEWHKNKPSIWELYYGTNRLNQTLAGKRGQLIKNSASIMSYPSSRPESDFTLDLPRAEQLRLKMEKEKKFRHRCRILTTFLSLVFFLLTVMVVSLVLTRGKRMFGSML